MFVQKENLEEIENMLLNALNNVENEYIKTPYNRIRPRIQRPEHSFTSELYHQLRILQENGYLTQLGLNHSIRFNADLSKTNYNVNEIPCLIGFSGTRTRPDIVLHGEQNSLEDQLLVVEIKMEKTDASELLYDFQKLLYYKLSNLRFENSIFIYSGTKDGLELLIKNSLSTKIINCLMANNIFVAVREDIRKKKGGWNLYSFESSNKL